MYKIVYRAEVSLKYLLIGQSENRDASDAREPFVPPPVAPAVVVGAVYFDDEVVVGKVEINDPVVGGVEALLEPIGYASLREVAAEHVLGRRDQWP